MEDSNIILPEVNSNVMSISQQVYSNMLNNAKHLDRPLCSLCKANSEKGIFVKDHFHGSDFGACYRHTQLSILHPKQKISDPIKQIFLRDGHLNENVMIELLEQSYTTGYHDQEIIFQDTVKIKNETIPVKIVSHPDLVIDLRYLSNTFNINGLLVEFKAVKDWFYKEVASKGLVPKKYYGQCQIYMESLNIDYALLFVKNRHTSEILPPFVIQRNPTWIQDRLKYLAAIKYIMLQPKPELVPREYTNKNCAECKFCEFREMCWE